MLDKKLIELLYDAANCQRWNDHLRPNQGFTELDKQAHKMVIAYILARFQEDKKIAINWRHIIEGGIFEFLHRLVITDIKPPVYYELKRDNGKAIDDWVIGRLEDVLKSVGCGFYEKFVQYLTDKDYAQNEKRILEAAHYLATSWEFKIVYSMNKDIIVGIEDTKVEILSQINDYADLYGVQNVALDQKTQKLINLVGQLRFQKRWAQSPRIPETSVMGHMLIVAIFAYFCSIKINACDRRIVNNYFCGLLHDLPEVLTRDIISPVKRSVTDLDEKIKQIEANYLHEKLYPLLPENWHDEIKYFIEDEFSTRVKIGEKREKLTDFIVPDNYNQDKFQPVDGKLLKCCDNLSALIEAAISYKHGIFSKHLLEGMKNIKKALEQSDKIPSIDFDKVIADFFIEQIIVDAESSQIKF